MNANSEHIDDLIAKVLAGEASRAEIDVLEGWMNEAKENALYFDETKKLFTQIESFKVEHKVDTLKAWEKLDTRISSEDKYAPHKIIPLFQRPVFRIAASIMLIATLALLVNYYFNSPAPVPAIFAAEKHIKSQGLPDGTKVTLNKNSELAYIVNDKKKVREVKLKGEAYFEVVHNEDLPFEITIDDIIIKDIGTAFNVKALPGSNVVEVLVEEGEVHFYTTSNEGLNLVKGEKALYNKTSKEFSKVTPKPSENTVSYKSKAFQFKGSLMRDVVNQLNAIYDSNIVLSDERLGNCRLTTRFTDLSVDGIVDIIAETLDFEVERSGGKIILKGKPCVE
ncbi:hypothetical protein CNR22_17225 [Sphingobacteriaceae bacterium]|nr:hypothetical protein CNR22_17225 [Sphingobacteriaceae bacterium]